MAVVDKLWWWLSGGGSGGEVELVWSVVAVVLERTVAVAVAVARVGQWWSNGAQEAVYLQWRL